MEKKKYEELELEVVRLDGSDVITTSGEECNLNTNACLPLVFS